MASVQQDLLDGRLLFLDGFQTTSSFVRRWIRRFESRCKCEFAAPVPFSYAGWDQKYVPADTLDSLLDHRASLLEHMTNLGSRVTPVGYSLGSVVSVLGSGITPERIDQVVLVAPAFTPDPSIIDEFGGQIPLCLQPLLDANDPVHREIDAALETLTRKGVRLSVLYSSFDTYCPFLGLPGAHLIPLSIRRQENESARGFHIRIKEDPSTLAELCRLLFPDC